MEEQLEKLYQHLLTPADIQIMISIERTANARQVLRSWWIQSNSTRLYVKLSRTGGMLLW